MRQSWPGCWPSAFTVINYDRRGRGDSGDTGPYAVEREVEDLDALIQAAGGSASVFGSSSGAVLALRAAASGLNITRLAVYEPPFPVDGDPLPAGFQVQLEQLLAAGRRGGAVKHFMRTDMGVPAVILIFLRLLPGTWGKLTAMAHTLPYEYAVMGDTLAGRWPPSRGGHHGPDAGDGRHQEPTQAPVRGRCPHQGAAQRPAPHSGRPGPFRCRPKPQRASCGTGRVLQRPISSQILSRGEAYPHP